MLWGQFGQVVKFLDLHNDKNDRSLPVLVVSLTSLQNKAQLCCSMWNRPWGRYLENCYHTDPKNAMRLVEQKAFCFVHNGAQWQAQFACLYICWMHVRMVGGTV